MKIKNDEQAYLYALALSITATNEEKARECIKIADSIGLRLTSKQKDLCKKAIEIFNELLT